MPHKRTTRLKIIATSDVHGCFMPYDFIENKPASGSLARACTYINNMRKHYGNRLILLDCGDMLQGQPICHYFNSTKNGEMNIASRAINYLKFDACAIGNHDLATGNDVFDKWTRECGCPIVAANMTDSTTGKPYCPPYAILEREGIKIAVLGMVTSAAPLWLYGKLRNRLHFESITTVAASWVESIRNEEHPDLIIGLFHSGWNGGTSTDLYDENEVERTARDVPGLDAIFFGHDHVTRQETITNKSGHKVPCLNPSCNANSLAVADVTITKEGSRVVCKTISGSICDIKDEQPDLAFMEYFKEAAEETITYCSKRIATIDKPIHAIDGLFGNAPFTDLIHNLQLAITHADISLSAPLSANISIEKGLICIRDMFKLYKYDDLLYVMRLNGMEIKACLEMSYELWTNTMTTPYDHIVLIANDTEGHGSLPKLKNNIFNFDSAAGIDYEVDVTKPYGQKIKIKQMSDGKQFCENRWYNVVTNSYRGNGGGDLLTKGAGIAVESLQQRIVWQSDKGQRQCLMEQMSCSGTIAPKANNNWKFVPEEWADKAIARDKANIFRINPGHHEANKQL